MHATDTDGRFPTPTTRRTVVRTGAKLAYAAPLVAASFTLGAGRVWANGMVSPGCRPDVCGAGGPCGPCRDDLCLLLCSVELVPVCVDVTTPACSPDFDETFPSCASSADCGAGRVCLAPTCCGGRSACFIRGDAP
jgi:hypothetical protein